MKAPRANCRSQSHLCNDETSDLQSPLGQSRRALHLARWLRCATEQVIDFRPVLAGELYRPLRELALFNQVKIDHEVHTLVWPNGADFDPAMLHDWPENAEAFAARAREWESQPAHV